MRFDRADSRERSPRAKMMIEAEPDSHDWQGAREDKTLYDLLCIKEYSLSTAIAATASRFGSEVPALTRILISHSHIRGWAGEYPSMQLA